MLWYGLCVVTISLNCVFGTEVRQCKTPGSPNAQPSKVQFSDCETPPCLLKRGTNVSIEIQFVSEHDHAELTNNIFATVMGIKQGYPGLDGTNACNNVYSMPGKIKTSCPLRKNEPYLYEIGLYAKPNFPKISTTMHFGLRDKALKMEAACFEVLVKLT